MDSKIKEGKLILESILLEVDQFSARLQGIKEEELSKDLFTQIDLLLQLDQSQAVLFSLLPKLEECQKELISLENTLPSSEQLAQITSFQQECLQVLNHLQPQLGSLEEGYEVLAEKVLYRCQDQINKLIDKILEHRQKVVSLKDTVGLELDEENQLREIRDSLETYREIRLENIKEGGSDSLINQLDSQIVACDSALLIDESSL